LMEILAVSRLLGDTDVLGGGGGNAGFVIERNTAGRPIAVRAVKIDAGESFNFNGENNQLKESYNTRSRLPKLSDRKDCQFGNAQPTVIRWESLSLRQREQFITKLSCGLSQLREENYLRRLIHREGEFDQGVEGNRRIMTDEVVDMLIEDWQEYLEIQSEVYAEELDAASELDYSPRQYGAA